MKSTILLTTLITFATTSPLEKRFPPNAKTPAYSHLWQNNAWTPITTNLAHAKWAPSTPTGGYPIDTISTFLITPSDLSKTFNLRFFSPGDTTARPVQAVQVFSNNVKNVPGEGVSKVGGNGRNEHLGSFTAEESGVAGEVSGSPEGYRGLRFEEVGRVAFSVVGAYVQNPTDLVWDARAYGLFLEEV